MKKLLPLLLLTSCLKQVPDHVNQFEDIKYDLDQTNGLSNFERRSFYNMSQGIYYLPYNVISSMSRPSESEFRLYDELFFEDPERLGLIPNPFPNTEAPIGITISSDPGFVPMFGVSCATCHTNVIKNDKNQAFLIDGAGSKFAIDRLIKEMVTSTILTLVDPIEFDKFYDRYKEKSNIKEEVDSMEEFTLVVDTNAYRNFKNSLKNNVYQDVYVFQQSVNFELQKSGTTTLDFGVYPTNDDLNTRFKMFVYLTKRLQWFLQQAEYASGDPTTAPGGLGRGSPWGSTMNMYANLFFDKQKEEWPIAPEGAIDTPFIWKYDDAKWIFATGTTNSMVERNFAQGIALLSDFNSDTYESTITIQKLEDIQGFTRKYQPPVWPENILGKVNMRMVNMGKQVFQENCLNCHNPKRETFTGPGSIEYNYLNVGTDNTYFTNQTKDFYGKSFIDDVLPPVMSKVKAAAASNGGIKDMAPFEIGREKAVWRAPKFNTIVAKPLWGIWATAPYLHNGSVINMRQLLDKPEYRFTKFHVGSIEYDVNNMGFMNKQTAYSSLFETDCTNCAGNSNRGHNYGTNLSDTQKNALIEFLKIYNMNTTFE